uniref:Rho-GAP domain-containing protein n=1 Tax=Panagrolaimus superbus TaxID=310955 RepID=A0A914Z7P2_9BILA
MVVDKPVPKPRTMFPPTPGFITPNTHELSDSQSSNCESPTPAPSLPATEEYGWHPKLVHTVSSESSDSFLSCSDASAMTPVAPPPSSEASPMVQLSPARPPPPPIPEPPSLPLPRLPIETDTSDFEPPVGPAPPIPPRYNRDKALPEPVEEESFLRLSIGDTISLSQFSEPKLGISLTNISSNGQWLASYDGESFGSNNSRPSSSQSASDVYDFLRPALGNIDILLPQDASLKADGENITFSGYVQLKTGKKESKRLMAFIRSRQLLFKPSDLDDLVVHGPYDLSRLLFVGKSIENASDIIVVLRSVKRGQTITHGNAEVLKFAPEDNFHFWITLLAKCNCPNYRILQDSVSEIDGGGKIFIREGTTGLWDEGFAFIRHNTFFYFIRQDEQIKCQDIRKFVKIKMDLPLADYCNHISHSHSGPLIIMLDGLSICLQNENDGATKTWFNFLQAQLRRPSRRLSECRLTSDDIPVIVDKCIKFVSTYGIRQPGLYRKNGPNAKARAIFDSLKNEPFDTHLTFYNDETINAASDVLRTFFRQLDIPLIPSEIQPELYTISDRYRQPLLQNVLDHKEVYEQLLLEKAHDYRSAIKTLPPIHYSTLQKLVDHLVEVNAHEADNRASIDNLARVFGPTIFSVDKSDESPSCVFSKTGLQITVMKDFIQLFDKIFDVTHDKKAIDITEAFELKCASKPIAEGFLISIHFISKDNQCFNVQSSLTAEQIVEYKIDKLKSTHESDGNVYGLYEIAKEGSLERRIGDRETLNSIVLQRWMKWKAKDTFILFKKESFFFNPGNTRPFAENIKICEPDSKNFKSAQLRIENGKKIQQFPKGEKLNKPQKEWKIDETVWFMGNVADRKYPPDFPFTTTFILKMGKYNIKYAGFCVAFSDEVQRNQWLNAVMACQRDYSPVDLIPDL